MEPETIQKCLFWSNAIMLFGAVLAAGGSFSAYYFGNKVNKLSEDKMQSTLSIVDQKVDGVDDKLTGIDHKLTLIAETNDSQKHKWNEAKIIAPAIADYVMLIFKSTGGRISGNCRIKGTDVIYPFSTDVNDKIQLAVKNKWQEEKGNYTEDPFLEYEIIQKSQDMDTLKIFTAGYKMAFGM